MQVLKRLRRYFRDRKRKRLVDTKSNYILYLINNDSFMDCVSDEVKSSMAAEVLRLNKL